MTRNKVILILMIYTFTLFAQTQLTGKKICIDPGHGGHDSDDREMPLSDGTGTYWESDYNWKRSLWIVPMLQSLGATVKNTKTTQSEDPGLSTRVATSNSFNADHFHSLHTNSGNGTANYTAVIYRGATDATPSNAEAKRMCDLMKDDLFAVLRTSATYSRADFPINGYYFGVLAGLNMPGSLSEACMHDFELEKRRLMNDMYLKGTCWGITRGFLRFWAKPGMSTGDLVGIVKDNMGKVLNQVNVVLTPGSKSYTGDIYTNGCYGYDNLAPGSYTITVSKTGYISKTVNVTVAANVMTIQDVQLTPNNVVKLVTPVDLATGQSINPSFTWQSITGATNYKLQVSTKMDFSALVFDNNVGNVTTYALTTALTTSTKYYWRVTADNLAGAYSDTWSFIVGTIPMIVLGDFEAGIGTFSSAITASGSTTGISKKSSISRVAEAAYNSNYGLKIIMQDSTSNTASWLVRILSGGGAAANNTKITATVGNIGFWMKSSTAANGAKVAMTLDDEDGTKTEITKQLGVINDGQWHSYQWNIESDIAGSFNGGNGVINGPQFTIDAIMYYSADASPACTLFVDDVLFNKGGALPVELANFSASCMGNIVNLYWETITEKNNSGFAIERKQQGGIYQSVGFVNGNGTSSEKHSYNYSDELKNEGTYIYRLKQIDLNGDITYSHENKVEFIKNNKCMELSQNYPNPFNPSTLINYQLALNNVSVKLLIYDVLGNEVITLVNDVQNAGSYSVKFNAGNFASGMYIAKLTAGGFTKTIKMNLVK